MNVSSGVIKESSHLNFHRRLEINWTYFSRLSINNQTIMVDLPHHRPQRHRWQCDSVQRDFVHDIHDVSERR